MESTYTIETTLAQGMEILNKIFSPIISRTIGDIKKRHFEIT